MTPADFHTARKALGLTQDQLAAALHRSKSVVSQWERGILPVDPLAWCYMGALAAGHKPLDTTG